MNCILLVDDDEITNYVNESVIDDMDIVQEVRTAHNGRQALELIERQAFNTKKCPELIFIDINMPVMNGFEFLMAYQHLEKKPNWPVVTVMLTSSVNRLDVEKAKEVGADDFISKPLTADKVKQVMTKYF